MQQKKNKGDTTMKNKWNELTKAQKVRLVLACIYVTIAMVFCVLDLTGTWKNNLCLFMIAGFCLVDGITGWKKNRNLAMGDFALCIILLVEALS